MTLAQNLDNKRKRYALSKQGASHLSVEADSLFNSALEIEKMLIANTSIDIMAITTEQVDTRIGELENFLIKK